MSVDETLRQRAYDLEVSRRGGDGVLFEDGNGVNIVVDSFALYLQNCFASLGVEIADYLRLVSTARCEKAGKCSSL
jgi:hypothetical protein